MGKQSEIQPSFTTPDGKNFPTMAAAEQHLADIKVKAALEAFVRNVFVRPESQEGAFEYDQTHGFIVTRDSLALFLHLNRAAILAALGQAPVATERKPRRTRSDKGQKRVAPASQTGLVNAPAPAVLPPPTGVSFIDENDFDVDLSAPASV